MAGSAEWELHDPSQGISPVQPLKLHTSGIVYYVIYVSAKKATKVFERTRSS
jgi:hypothetical protein